MEKKIACAKCGNIVKVRGYPGEIKIIRCSECLTRGTFKFTEDDQHKQIKKNKSPLISQMPYVLVIIIILVSHFLFKTENLTIFVSFILLIPIFVFFQFDGRIPIIYTILMLVLSVISLILNKNESFANQLAIYAYWLLVVGAICLLIEYLRELKKSNTRT